MKKKNSDDDDDEKKPQPVGKNSCLPPPPPLSPDERFCQILRERHGAQFNASRCLKNVKAQLAKSVIGLSMADFLAYDADRTTAPQKLTNPNGHYVALARELVEEQPTAGAFLQQLLAQRIATAPPPRRLSRSATTRGAARSAKVRSK
jgi:hypothetical protein